MSETDWAIGHPHHDVVGPRYCMPNTLISGVEARVDDVHGIMDLRLCFRNADGTESELHHSDWITDYAGYNRVVAIQFDPNTEFIVGMNIRERNGTGITDLNLILREHNINSERATDWILHDEDASETCSLRVPEQEEMRGILAKERATEGIVDLKILT